MRILHYFLGFPPYRSGGLTIYAMNLMEAQVADGHAVAGLWPGSFGILNQKTGIRKNKTIKGIESYELINPLPVSLDEGIEDIEAFTAASDPVVYRDFLNSFAPDVIHLHTLMGIHKEFLETAKDMGIRTVFTTHDYFGICPVVTLFHNGKACTDDHDCSDCAACCQNALSLKKIMVLQSAVYRVLKDSYPVRILRKRHRGIYFENMEEAEALYEAGDRGTDYRKLRAFYIAMLEMIDLIHFNSALTEKIYRRYVKPADSVVMTITHKGIFDNRKAVKHSISDKLRITMLAPAKPYKGFSALIRALDILWENGNQNFTLRMFGNAGISRPYLSVTEGAFTQNMLPEIFENTDILAAPSVWYETFGFTVLEAISYGVPVIVSDHVGAIDIVGRGGIITEAGNEKKLAETIGMLDRKAIDGLRENILKDNPVKLWKDFVSSNYSLYQ